MYVTRRLSQLQRSPEEALAAPPEGPNSGYLVIQDEDSETYCCFGLCKRRSLKELPFPQNKELTIVYIEGEGESIRVHCNPVFLIPAPNQPLSSDRYYAIVPHGKHIGKAFTCSREEDKVNCFFCRCVKDAKSRPLDPQNVYQQIEVFPREALCSMKGEFFAKSIASDGFPPKFLRRKGWSIYTKTAENCELDTAEGIIDSNIRFRLPEFNFPISRRSSESSIVGKWYCPFVFVQEETLTLRDQVKKSMYYQITLEQRWEQVFTCSHGNSHSHGSSVAIDALIEKEEVLVDGVKAFWNERDGVIWFTIVAAMGEEKSVGLRVEVVQRMRWEEEGIGYSSGGARQVTINRWKNMEKLGNGVNSGATCW